MATFPILRAHPATLRRLPERPKQASLTLFPPAARHGNCEPPCGASAPPPATHRSRKPATELAGIARLAASSPCAEAKRGTEYYLLPVRSILNECHSERVPFRWTVNPYRGCEFGCRYCYARYTHEYLEHDAADFESKIYVKQDAGALAARDLAREDVWGEHIAIGTATDPYQPAEREFGVTRAILEKMALREGLSVSITTKSNLVVRDIELLQRIAGRSSLTRQFECDDAADGPGAAAGTARAASGPAPGSSAPAARGWNRRGSVCHADSARADRPRRGSRCVGARGARGGRAVARCRRGLPDAVVVEGVFRVSRGEVSPAGGALPGTVSRLWGCAGKLRAGAGDAGS